jgi:hypothetical protein
MKNITQPKEKLNKKEEKYIWSVASLFLFLRLSKLFIGRKKALEALEIPKKIILQSLSRIWKQS